MINTGELSGKHVRSDLLKIIVTAQNQRSCNATVVGEVPTGSHGYAISGVAKPFSFYYWGRGLGT